MMDLVGAARLDTLLTLRRTDRQFSLHSAWPRPLCISLINIRLRAAQRFYWGKTVRKN